ncbi:MAG: ABC transporter permease [Lachnospiraceae bacterium]
MKFNDLLAMSVNNLRRRKLRTALTVLGVIIGTASIIVMVSLGIGLQEMTMEQFASYGSLTAITVYSDSMWSMNGDSNTEPNHMTDETMKEFERLEHVKSVSPLLNTNVILKQGQYTANVSLIGVTREYLEEIPIGEGALPDVNATELQMVVGNWIQQQFSNGKRGGSYWETGELPDVDFMNRPMFAIFDTDAYYQSQYGNTTENVTPPKKYLIQTAGIVEGGPEEYNNYCYGIYVDIDLLQAQLRRIFRRNPIPGQPTNKKGKPYNYFIYDQAVVYVDDMENVSAVQKMITDMGYQANSQMEWLEQSQQTAGMIQAVLGGIGAVSLLVAAIGIANTMMMSIYERTKEIGVMKVLGCDMNNIRNMFLLESGFIGFMGGVVGLLISYGISFLMNRFLGLGQAMMGVDGNLSRIPLWLAGFSLIFAVVVGMLAGLFPSLRAMKLSPLAAIRNE